MPNSQANIAEFTVSELSAALKRTVEDAYGYVRVRGEVSGFKGPHGSGHVYFRLKDESATIEAVIWKGVFGRMRLKPEEGLEVVVTGTAHHLPRPLELPDRHRDAGAGRRRRADGAAGGAQAQARRRRPVRRGAQAAAAVPAGR